MSHQRPMGMKIPPSHYTLSDLVSLLRTKSGDVTKGDPFLLATALIDSPLSGSKQLINLGDSIKLTVYLGVVEALPFVHMDKDDQCTLTLRSSKYYQEVTRKRVLHGELPLQYCGVSCTDIYERVNPKYINPTQQEEWGFIYPYELVVGAKEVEAYIFKHKLLADFYTVGRRMLGCDEPKHKKLLLDDARFVRSRIETMYDGALRMQELASKIIESWAGDGKDSCSLQQELDSFRRKMQEQYTFLSKLGIVGENRGYTSWKVEGGMLHVSDFLKELHSVLFEN